MKIRKTVIRTAQAAAAVILPGLILSGAVSAGAAQQIDEITGAAAHAAAEDSKTSDGTAGASIRSESDREIEELLESMSLSDKIAQLFVVTPEALTGTTAVTEAGTDSENAVDVWPVGGLIFFSDNLVDPDQTAALLTSYQEFSMDRIGLPMFLCVDEEGGTVARIANNDAFGIDNVGNMASIGASMDTENAAAAGGTIGTYLADLGFNVDFAPVADIWTNPENTVVQYRAFGSDAQLVSGMAAAFLDGLEEAGVYGVYKHFPGHGDTTADTHEGYAFSDRTLAELESCEFLPFAAGIEQGVSFIMAGHIALPNVTGDNTPASLSKEILDLLREDLGYDGIIITDALNMSAITETYTSAEAAVAALQAGADLLLMPENFTEAYTGVLQAVADGTLSQERIDESLARILRVKWEMLNEG